MASFLNHFASFFSWEPNKDKVQNCHQHRNYYATTLRKIAKNKIKTISTLLLQTTSTTTAVVKFSTEFLRINYSQSLNRAQSNPISKIQKTKKKLEKINKNKIEQ